MKKNVERKSQKNRESVEEKTIEELRCALEGLLLGEWVDWDGGVQWEQGW